MAARGGGSTRWASQAAQDALLKFSPQRTSLADALRAAQETYGQTVQAGNTSAKLTQAAARAAYPAIGQIYAKADAGTQAGQTLVNSDLAALPGVANQYKADQAGEVQQQLANLLAARSSDQAMLTNQGTAAAAGAQFNQTNARQALQKTVAGLISKSQTTSQEQGAFAASEAERLAQEAEKLNQQETASIRSANTSTANNQRSVGASEANNQRSTGVSEANNKRSTAQSNTNSLRAHGPGAGPAFTAPGVKEASVDAHNKARDTIEKIRREAFEVRNEHQNYNVAQQDLEAPIKTKTYSRQGYAKNGILKAGLDLAYFGGIGTGTLQQLHREGFSLGKLGYPVYKPKAPSGGSGFLGPIQQAATRVASGR